MSDEFEALWRRAAHDDEAFRVLADHLTDRGDPQGEFIHASLTGTEAAEQQARALLREHRAHWLGPLADIVVPGTDRWHRGRLRGFKVEKNVTWPSSEHLAWSTIEWLDLGGSNVEAASGVIDDLRIPLRELRRVRPWDDVETLLCRRSPRTRLDRVSTTPVLPLGIGTPEPLPPVLLDIGTLEVPLGHWVWGWESMANTPTEHTQFLRPASGASRPTVGGLDDRTLSPPSTGAQAPFRVDGRRQCETIRIPVPSPWHRELSSSVERAMVAHQRTGIRVVLDHDLGDDPALRLELEAGTLEVTLWLSDGRSRVSWKLLRRLAEQTRDLKVVGLPNPRTVRRLDAAFATWSIAT